MVSELIDEQARLAALSGSDDVSLRAMFDLSYQQLSPPAAALYRRLGIHPGREFGSKVTCAVLGASPTEAEDLLYGLVDVNLVEDLAEDRFRLHDLLRLHARHRGEVDEAPPQREAILRRILEWYLAAAAAADRVLTPYRRRLPYEYATPPIGPPEFADREQALSWMETERENLLVAGQVSLNRRWFELSWQLADVLWPLLLYRKHYRDRLTVDERGVLAAREWGNPVAEADMLKRLGLALRTRERHEEAAVHLQASLAMWSELGDERGCAEAHDALGVLYLNTDRFAEAVEEFEQTLTRFRKLGDRRGAGLALINLALALPRLGRAGQARQRIEEARLIFDGLQDEDPYNAARVLVVLAALQCSAGEASGASETAATGLTRMRQLGSDFGAAEAHEVLAEAELSRGDIASARYHLDHALATFTSLRSPRATALRSRLWNRIHQVGGSSDDLDGVEPS